MSQIAWNELGKYLRETQLLGSIHSSLYWDQNTTMPKLGASWRGDQLTFLARSIHARQSCKKFEELLDSAKKEFHQSGFAEQFNPEEAFARSRNLELLEQEFRRQKKLDPELVSQLATAQVEGYTLWQNAKADNDFSSFAPALKKLILLRQEEARQINEDRSCWETLAQPFEPDLSIKRLNELFKPLRRRLPDILENTKNISKKHILKWDLDEKSQEELCEKLLKKWGRQKEITSVGRSPHPFSITLGPKDFRLTTRIVPGQPLSCFLATAHEWGHSLYEQGLPSETHQWFAWPLGQATSMAVHESQSLFWENRIARSRSFSEVFWRDFSDVGAPFNSADDMWRSMNPMMPGLNRVEADELTYGLHILIRTDLEIAMLENGLEVEGLPNEWNKRYKELLGITPSSDSEGCLQDVHWSEGSFGYFPSYLLGHLISAQLSDSMSFWLKGEGIKGPDPIGECIYKGDESKLLSWLRKEVHRHGRRFNAEQLIKQVTGKPLSSDSFLNYLESKLEMLAVAH